MNNKESQKPKAQYLYQLAAAYNVDVKTFKSWLECDQLKDIIENKKGYYFKSSEVERIYEHLGAP